jgi:hypothetical protein
MLSDKYNYSLNGINHEIILNHSLKIDQEPINDKILVSNKYIIKYINDLFDYISLEYCFVGNSLMGIYIFNGINIFNSLIEICILDCNFLKIKKIEDDIKNDGFDIYFNNNYIKISNIFFDNIKVEIFIYLLVSDSDNDLLKYTTINNINISHEFYDIFPIKKTIFEDYEVSVPNKIEKVLETYNFNLNYIIFTKNKCDKKIIEEIENKKTLNTIERFISIIVNLV